MTASEVSSGPSSSSVGSVMFLCPSAGNFAALRGRSPNLTRPGYGHHGQAHESGLLRGEDGTGRAIISGSGQPAATQPEGGPAGERPSRRATQSVAATDCRGLGTMDSSGVQISG